MKLQKAILAGGCFWGMEEILRKVPGVVKTTVGYCGGSTSTVTYKEVCTGTSGHAEAIEIEFDSEQLSFAALLKDWFFKMHDPTTLNRQGNDLGSQYRSAIFYSDESQKREAMAVIEEVSAAGLWPRPIVTEVVPAKNFCSAEEHHQDYLQKNPGGYTCHYLRP